MSDARQAFHDLHGLAGGGFDASEIAHGPDRVERRVARWRGVRMAVTSAASIAVVAAVAVGANATRAAEPLPASSLEAPVTATATPTPDAGVSQGTDLAGCSDAVVVAGKPVGNLGGLEGWFNGTPVAPCSEWDQQILDHPDTVLIYTGDNTMVEAYYRTSIDALGPYSDLGPDFKVPDPDPDWPENVLVLIDARSGEVLSVHEVPETFGTAEEGATAISDRLLSDTAALEDRFAAVASEADAPDGFQIDPSASVIGTDADLADPLVFVPADYPIGEDLPSISARIVPGDETAALSPDAVQVKTQLPITGATLTEIAEPGSARTPSMQLSIPIGDDATLLLVGYSASADRYLIELVAWHILAE
ncbi:hypothetical protein ACNI3K_06205 [Demequina sp. SO4-13]|uniref:hypothetical protein n=1 Tax=Demequina sp. SO4-13 TaxID=3401027 RepID=UPI003AF8631F